MAVQDKIQPYQRMREFIQEVMAEIKKIVWPTRETLIQSTSAVLAVVVLLGFYLAAADVLLRLFFTAIE